MPVIKADRNPFIGITDFTTPEEVKEMRRVWERNGGRDLEHVLGVGVMTSQKVLNDERSPWSNVFPRPEDISDIFMNRGLVMNTLHYADYREIDLAENLERLVQVGGRHMHAIQLDMSWPSVTALKAFRRSYPNILLILQIGREALFQVDRDPNKLRDKLFWYGDSVDYVLLDESMGEGVAMVHTDLGDYVHWLSQSSMQPKIIVAGGLGPGTLSLVAPLVAQYPYISIDAQAKLRRTGSTRDPIDWDLAREYLLQSIALFKKHKR